MKGSGEDGGA